MMMVGRKIRDDGGGGGGKDRRRKRVRKLNMTGSIASHKSKKESILAYSKSHSLPSHVF